LCRNTRRARKFDPKIIKTVNYEKRIQRRRDMKQQVLDKIKAVRVAKVTPVVVKKAGDKKKAAVPALAPKKK
jgi:hypothetical protein